MTAVVQDVREASLSSCVRKVVQPEEIPAGMRSYETRKNAVRMSVHREKSELTDDWPKATETKSEKTTNNFIVTFTLRL